MIRPTSFLFFLSFFWLIFLSPSFAQDTDLEALRMKLITIDDFHSAKETGELAISNPVLLEKILFIPDSEECFASARFNAFSFYTSCGISEKITHARFFDVSTKLLKNLPKIALKSVLDNDRFFIKNSIIRYGYDPATKANILKIPNNSMAFLICVRAVKTNNLFVSSEIMEKIEDYAVKIQLLCAKNSVSDLKNSISELEAIQEICEKIQDERGKNDGLEVIGGYAKILTQQIRDAL
jgi:hypothetical protein